MRLEANAVDLHTGLLNKFDNSLSTIGLGAVVLEVVVIIKQLSFRIDLRYEFER